MAPWLPRLGVEVP